MKRRTRRRGRARPTRSRVRRSRRRARVYRPLADPMERETMRKTVTGTGGMLLVQTLKDAGVDYLFTNPGSAETGIFAALSEDQDQKLIGGKHEGLRAADAAAITVATTRALREATTPPTGPVYLSISAELLLREGLEAQIGEAAGYQIERPGPARAKTIEAIARKLGEAQCPVLIFGDDVWREGASRSEEHTSELQSLAYLVCRLLLEKKKKKYREVQESLMSQTGSE